MNFSLIKQEVATVIFSSLITSSALFALPSQAATFAVSEGIFEISLSQNPLDKLTSTNTSVLSISNDPQSSVVALAEADAILATDLSSDKLICNFLELSLPAGCNISSSLAVGEGPKYFGLAQSTAQLVGNFFIQSGEKFSFDFLASLFLETASDNPKLETASAFGEISFQLYDTNSWTMLDSFTIASQLSGIGGNNFLSISQESENITFDFVDWETDFKGNTKLAQTLIVGNYSRFFSNDINLTLVETKTNQVSVKTTPEPSSVFAFLFILGLARIGLRSKQLKAN
jgi:hypothetical protein